MIWPVQSLGLPASGIGAINRLFTLPGYSTIRVSRYAPLAQLDRASDF